MTDADLSNGPFPFILLQLHHDEMWKYWICQSWFRYNKIDIPITK
ncbi:hypothetical protein FPSE_03346 [Fusarium pseudograminearum CS3096]|uniref:Uncharacterized protein n=1 Tax=Fusarium pseudograminearum (strain CS3096) TaxID=1028729 RepID=K3VNM8_FUSPC|nr:hypothetical protein FPSE_03346 [Fusarium pseudograminearum CS3096]EKJ76504.1 hypothetical protein FPSE_03346 [Fusarium pseudograminearum CS3096]